MPESIQQEAQAIVDNLASIPFQDCIPLSKEFRELPMSAGIYAVKHRTIGILYIGKARTLREMPTARCANAFVVVIKLYFGHSLKN